MRMYHGTNQKIQIGGEFERLWTASVDEADIDNPIYFWKDDFKAAKDSALMAAAISGDFDNLYVYELHINDEDLKLFKQDPIHFEKGSREAYYISEYDFVRLKNQNKLKITEIEHSFTRIHAPFILSLSKDDLMNKDRIPKDIWDLYQSIKSEDFFELMLKPILSF